jgi:hypothetical protein
MARYARFVRGNACTAVILIGRLLRSGLTLPQLARNTGGSNDRPHTLSVCDKRAPLNAFAKMGEHFEGGVGPIWQLDGRHSSDRESRRQSDDFSTVMGDRALR